jgi:dolichol-phosphate mannosyltransferase
LLAIISLVLLTWVWLVAGVPFAGFGSMAALIIDSFGFHALMMGVMGEYIALIYEESKSWPNFNVSETLGIDS